MTTPFGSSLATTVNLSGNSTLDSLLIGTKWASGVITYSFATSTSVWSTDFFTGYGTAFFGNEPYTGYDTLTSLDQTFTTQALSSWSNVSNLTFVKVADNGSTVGDIRFAYSSLHSDAQAWAYAPENAAIAGDVWFNSNGSSNYYKWTQGSYEFLTVVHELGHALGLDHPFSGIGKIAAALPQDQDYLWNTVMSYSAQPGQTSAYLDFYPTTPMGIDIQAMQYLYGANTSYHAGNDTYTFSQGSHYLETIWDAGGIDTIKYTATSLGCEIDLRPGEWSQLGLGVNIYNAGSFVRTEYNTVNIYDTVIIENAIGSTFADKIYGNLADNHLSGGGGNDTLDGGDGADTLDGGAGDDTMTGGLGNDSLDGGLGNDTMVGGAGNDIYFVNVHTDIITEFGGEGIDTINAGLTYSLADTDGIGNNGGNVEKLILTGTAAINGTGNDLNNILTGNAAANILNGGIGADTLFGGAGADTLDGGAGADTLQGQLGNDIYLISDALDTVIEDSDTGSGIDTIKTTLASYDLQNAANVENLTYNSLDTQSFIGTGNDLKNSITGGKGDDVLNGLAGIDTLTGGLGNDTYYVNLIQAGVDAAAKAVLEDVVTELSTAGSGTDTLILQGSLSLTNVTTLILASTLEHLDASATIDTKLNLTGNNASNSLTGNAVDNTLFGLIGNDTLIGNAGNDVLNGGVGIDTLKGGAGNDTYVIDNIADVIDEEANLDTSDTVKYGINASAILTSTLTIGSSNTNEVKLTAQTSASLDLTQIENLTITGTGKYNLVGNDADNILTGNASANIIVGGAGNDTLNGGAGLDTLNGGDGNDEYFVDSAAEASLINDSSGIDTLNIGLTYTLTDPLENLTLIGITAINGTGNAADNIIRGNDAANILDGKAGADSLNGGKGNDTYLIDNVSDTVIEILTLAQSGGIDTVRISAGYSGTSRTAEDNVDNLDASLFANGIHLAGNDLANIMTGGAGNDILDGGAGNDTINGGAGSDTLDGGAGIDTLKGGTGDDVYHVDLKPFVIGSSFSVAEDIISEELAGGIDTLVLYGESFGYQLNANIENLDLSKLTSNQFWTYGNDLNNDIKGHATLDNLLDGGAGNDTLHGGAGRDNLIGGVGADLLIGGDNSDYYEVDNLGDQIIDDGTFGFDRIIGKISIDLRSFSNIEEVELKYGAGNLNATGNDFSNVVSGNDGNNILDGGGGNDTVYGGYGNDTIIGGLGTDTLLGGSGVDIFDFNAINESGFGINRDVIFGFSHTEKNKIDFSTIDANEVLDGNQAFAFIGSADFSHVAGELRYVGGNVTGRYNNGFFTDTFTGGTLSGDVNGDGLADFEIVVIGVTSLAVSDFTL